MLPNTLTNLQEVSRKLEYLIGLQELTKNTNDPRENHKYAVLTHYLNEIQSSINDIAYEIDEMYDTVIEYQSGNTVDTFEDLYNDIRKDIRKDTDFMKAFGPYMVLWNSVSTD